MEEKNKYTHMDYRKAKVVHLINKSKEEEFMYRGKSISKEEADSLVEEYLARKNK